MFEGSLVVVLSADRQTGKGSNAVDTFKFE